MKNAPPNVIMIGYAKRVLKAGTREHERMRQYAKVLESLHVIVLTTKKEGFEDVVQSENLSVYATNASTKVGAVYKAYIIGKRIIAKQAESNWTVSSQDPFAAGVIAWFLSLLPGAKLHVQVHGDVLNPLFFTNRLSGWCKTIIGLCILKRAKKIRVVSERIKKSLIKQGLAADIIKVLPIQPHLEDFFKVANTRTYSNDIPLTILYVGRFSEEKNISLLLKASALLKEQTDNFKVVLLGDGQLRSNLKREVEALNLSYSVSLEEWTDDVSSVMAKADILSLTSFHEGYAMVLLEAMATGLPIVTTDVGCAGEVVKDVIHGRIVTEFFDPGPFAVALKQLLDNPSKRAEYGKNGYKEAKQRTISNDAYMYEIRESLTIEE